MPDELHELSALYALDVLDADERARFEAHLAECELCRRRYRFEESLRRFVRQACVEPMPPELKERLSALRTPL